MENSFRLESILRPILVVSHLLTSSADCAMKNPTVLAGILALWGLMEILVSLPLSVGFTSIASSRSFNFTKQSLGGH